MFFDFTLACVFEFIGPGEFLYMRVNRAWVRAYLAAFDDETWVDYTPARLRYAIEYGYSPTTYALIYTSTNQMFDSLGIVCAAYTARRGGIPPFTLALCLDTPECVAFFEAEYPASVQLFLSRRLVYREIPIYQQAVELYYSSSLS